MRTSNSVVQWESMIKLQMKDTITKKLSILDILSSLHKLCLFLDSGEVKSKFVFIRFTGTFVTKILGDKQQIEWGKKYFWSPCIMKIYHIFTNYICYNCVEFCKYCMNICSIINVSLQNFNFFFILFYYLLYSM